jgi:hypothetical protein
MARGGVHASWRMAVVGIVAAALPAGAWVDSTVGVHSFLTFDSGMSDGAIAAAAPVRCAVPDCVPRGVVGDS